MGHGHCWKFVRYIFFQLSFLIQLNRNCLNMMPPLPYFLFIVGPVKLLHHLLQRNKNQKLKKTEKMLPSQPLELPRKLRLESINRLWKVMAKENRSMPAFALNLWYKCSRYQMRKMKIMEYLILIGKSFISIFLFRYSTYVHCTCYG